MPENFRIPDHAIRPKINTRQVPFYPDPLIKPPFRLPDTNNNNNKFIYVPCIKTDKSHSKYGLQ